MEFRTALCQLRLLCLHAREPRFSVRLDSFHKHIYFGGKVDIVSGFALCSSCFSSISRCWRSRSWSWDMFCQGFFTCVASVILCRTAVSNPFKEKRLWRELYLLRIEWFLVLVVRTSSSSLRRYSIFGSGLSSFRGLGNNWWKETPYHGYFSNPKSESSGGHFGAKWLSLWATKRPEHRHWFRGKRRILHGRWWIKDRLHVYS